ncbi:MAG: patatin-like phospholipase family protein [Gemmatimonadota bacterium]|nr:patatin-like phospholipase family protein [Gemmatimonadota bacterium]
MSAPHRPFTVVLGGGGARGFAHLGVLRALEHEGLTPQAVVGVSMGAVVGVSYAMRKDWYQAVLAMNLESFPGPSPASGEQSTGLIQKVRRAVMNLRVVASMILGWGPGSPARQAGLAELRKLVGQGGLKQTRIPVAVTATDLRSGDRVVLRSGPADQAVYASAALAGVLQPLELSGQLLADGAYSDLAPVDVAHELGSAVVIAVDAGQSVRTAPIRNGFQAIMRAMDICHRQHAQLRFAQADLVLRPVFSRSIDTLDFGARRECVTAGILIVRRERASLRRLLVPHTAREGSAGTMQVKSHDVRER